MSSKHVMSYDEALSLLGLKRRGARSRKAIDAAYASVHQNWSRALNAAITEEMRNRASDAIVLIHEAKKLCIENLAHCSRAKTRATGKHKAGQPKRAAPPRGSNFNVFPTLWRIITTIIKSIRILISSMIKFWSFLADVTRELESAGIPKAVTILVFVVVTLIVMNGCSQALNGLTGGLR